VSEISCVIPGVLSITGSTGDLLFEHAFDKNVDKTISKIIVKICASFILQTSLKFVGQNEN